MTDNDPEAEVLAKLNLRQIAESEDSDPQVPVESMSAILFPSASMTPVDRIRRLIERVDGNDPPLLADVSKELTEILEDLET